MIKNKINNNQAEESYKRHRKILKILFNQKDTSVKNILFDVTLLISAIISNIEDNQKIDVNIEDIVKKIFDSVLEQLQHIKKGNK